MYLLSVLRDEWLANFFQIPTFLLHIKISQTNELSVV